MNLNDWLTALLLSIGSMFFLAGTVGLLRFPDVYSRLHALTKADNLGLGFIVAGLMLQVDTWAMAGKLLLTWLLVLVSGAAVAHLVARGAIKRRIKPWTR